MKRTPEGIVLHKQRITEIATAALVEVKKTAEYQSADVSDAFLLSRLKTRVRVTRRKAVISYRLSVPEVNESFFREVLTDSEFAK